MTDPQAAALARLRRLAAQPNPDDLYDVYYDVPYAVDEDDALLLVAYTDDLRTVADMVAGDELALYVVGSVERVGFAIGYRFDYVHTDRDKAIAYCESRKNDRLYWLVFETRPGLDWVGWTVIHTTPRAE